MKSDEYGKYRYSNGFAAKFKFLSSRDGIQFGSCLGYQSWFTFFIIKYMATSYTHIVVVNIVMMIGYLIDL